MPLNNKHSRLQHLEILLKAHPEGLRRSEIAKRLGVHRSTAGRYVSELSEVTMLWENNYRVGINDRRTNPYIYFSLTENFTILVAIQALMNRLDAPFPHMSTVLRKISLAMKDRFPVSSEKMFKLADKIGNLSNPSGFTMADNFDQFVEALENKKLLDIKIPLSKHRAKILPENFSIANTGPLNRSLRVIGKCKKTGKRCSFLLHNIELLKDELPDEELSGCLFESSESGRNSIFRIKISTYGVMDNLTAITDNNFRFERFDNGTYFVDLLLPEGKDIQDILLHMGSDIEIIYSEHIRDSLRNNSGSGMGSGNKLSKYEPKKLEYTNNELTFESAQIREVHHRIKNQLVSLMGLINLYSKNQNLSFSILDELNAKLFAISTVHDMLSTGNFQTRLPVSDYILELCSNLISSMVLKKEIDLAIDIDNFSLLEDQVTNIGIIVTELCINSLKHAFTDRTDGKISISMTQKDKLIILIFKDNGIGWENNQENTLSEGTGHNLVNIFVDRLSGSIEYFSELGTKVVIKFT